MGLIGVSALAGICYHLNMTDAFRYIFHIFTHFLDPEA